MALSIKVGDTSSLAFALGSGIGSARRDESSAQQLVKGELNIASIGSADSQDAASVQIDGAAGLAVAITAGNVEKAQDAVDQISSLRAEQADLAALAADSPQNSFTASLNTEVQAKQDEIERVAAAATDQNGNSLLASGSGTLTSTLEASSRSATFGQGSSLLASDLSLSITSQVGAQDALDSLAEQDLGLSVTQAGLASAAGAVQDTQEAAAQAAEQQATQSDSSGEPTTPEYTSSNVAAQLGISAYSQQQELATLISASLSGDSTEGSGFATVA